MQSLQIGTSMQSASVLLLCSCSESSLIAIRKRKDNVSLEPCNTSAYIPRQSTPMIALLPALPRSAPSALYQSTFAVCVAHAASLALGRAIFLLDERSSAATELGSEAA